MEEKPNENINKTRNNRTWKEGRMKTKWDTKEINGTNEWKGNIKGGRENGCRGTRGKR